MIEKQKPKLVTAQTFLLFPMPDESDYNIPKTGINRIHICLKIKLTGLSSGEFVIMILV